MSSHDREVALEEEKTIADRVNDYWNMRCAVYTH